MRISKLYLPAVTVAGALALAGCGGGSSTPGGPPAGSDPETLEFAKGGFHNAGDGRLLTCDSDDGCELTVKDGKVQETEAELTVAGFTITNRRTPPATEMEAGELAAKVGRIFDTLGNTEMRIENSDASGNLVFGDDKVTASSYVTDIRNASNTENQLDIELSQTAVLDSLAGWKGTRYGPEDDDHEHVNTAVFYSNQDDPKSTPFAKWAEDSSQEGWTDATDDVAAHVDGGSDATNFGSLKITGFPSGPATKTHTSSVSGSFNGASGSFRCASAYCTSVNGRPSGGGWEFYPAPDAMVSEKDANYVRFGWWLREDGEDGEWANFQAIVNVSGTAPLAEVVAAWQGKAEYEGGAAGQYAIGVGSGQSGTEAGAFTAKATLTADFGDANDSGNLGSISGELSDFTASGNSKDWKVKLLKAPIAAAGTFELNNDGTQWTMNGEEDDKEGRWSGGLHTENAHGSQFDADIAAGQFYAEYENIGRMQGAFGAEYKE